MPSARTVSTSLSSGNPPVYAALLFYLTVIIARFRALGLHGTVSRSWRVVAGRPIAFLGVHADPESDTLLEDERQLVRAAREILVAAGFYVGADPEKPQNIRLTGYFGRSLESQAKPSPSLLSARETFPGSWVERWEKGPVAARRVRQLRRAFRSVTTRTTEDTRKLWEELGADRRTVAVLEISFTVPVGASIPTFVEMEVAA